MITGEAAREQGTRCEDLRSHSLAELEGNEYYREYDCVTDPMTSEKLNRVSHVAYGYATQVVLLDQSGKVKMWSPRMMWAGLST